MANEVRNLALRCAQTAQDTTALIAGSIDRSGTATTSVAELADAIRKITLESVSINTTIEEASQSGLEQIAAVTSYEHVKTHPLG